MNNDLSEALERLDIQSWLDREGIEYKVTRGSRGMQLNVRECPCCGDKKYRVYLNQESGLGNCFHGDCEETFSKWKFIRATLGHLSNREVVDHILAVAKELGWRPIKRTSLAVNMNTELVLPKSYALPIKGRNLTYLTNRNVTADATSYFKLRFSKSGRFEYEQEGEKLCQDYSNRIIIPIFDLDGDLRSFQGRDITDTAAKKYLFPPGFASTGEHLYNGHNAWGAEHILIGEGAFDVIAQKMALDEEPTLRDVVPVGTFGKHLSAGQVEKLMRLKERGLKTVTIMWDGERQALMDAVDAALELRSHGLAARVATLPAEKDPNEVAPSVVRDAFWKATAIDAMAATRLKLSRIYL